MSVEGKWFWLSKFETMVTRVPSSRVDQPKTNGDYYIIRTPTGGAHILKLGRGIYLTKEDAERAANQRRISKIASLKKQIEKWSTRPIEYTEMPEVSPCPE